MSRALQEVAALVQRESGIDAGRLGTRSLEVAIARIAPGVEAGDLLRTLADPRAGASLRALLIEALVVHETFFFRQRRDLDTIDWPSLLTLARAAGSHVVRVWVAACATGEEAYTVAILASEAFGSPAPPVSILATDISAAVLLRAEHGRYRGRTLHAVEDRLATRYFQRDGEMLAVNDALRALVRCRRHNLVHDPVPVAGGRFELILCRNALIYFDPKSVEQVLRLLEDALADGGDLILSAADRLCGPVIPRAAPPVCTPPQSRPARRRSPRQFTESAWRSPAVASTTDSAALPERQPAALALSEAMALADAGKLTEAVAATVAILDQDPLAVEAHFIRGIAELGLGDALAATGSLRRALYVEPGFALAAFTLGSAYDALGDDPAARRAYAQALRALTPGDRRYERLAADVGAADVAAACRARLAAPR